MIKYLLDTNVISELAKSVPNKTVVEKFKKYRHQIAIAAPVWHELLYGCCRLPVSRKRDAIESFLNNVVKPYLAVLPYDLKSAEWHASERARLSLIGQIPSFTDGLIASISAANRLILVTRNIHDFEMFSGLKIENWHEI